MKKSNEGNQPGKPGDRQTRAGKRHRQSKTKKSDVRQLKCLVLCVALSAGMSRAQESTPLMIIGATLPEMTSPSTALPNTTSPSTTLPSTTSIDMTLPSTELPAAGVQGSAPPAAALERVISFTVNVPKSSSETVVFQPLPQGVSVIPGRSTLNSQSVNEPLISERGAYFVLRGAAQGKLSFSVRVPAGMNPEALNAMSAGLLVRYSQGAQEVLAGSIDEADLRLATPTLTLPAERSGVIRSPQDGLSLRSRHSIDVVIDVPSGQNGSGSLSVNGTPVPAGQVGETSVYSDGHTRLKYIAVQLKPGVNTLSAFGDTLRVTSSGPAAQLSVTPARPLIADGSSPLLLNLDVQDAEGQPAELPSVSFTVTGSEPSAADADPLQSGHQLLLHGGQAQLSLRPLSQPGTITLNFEVNGHSQTAVFEVHANQHRLLIVHGGGTLSGGQAHFQGAASIEAPIAGGELYLAANSQGVNSEPLPYARYPAYGDASVNSQPLRAQGRLALRLELPLSHAEYGQDAAQDPVFGVHTGVDGLNFETNGETRFGASLTQVPGDARTATLTPDGTRVLRLPSGAVPGSETVTLERQQSGTVLSRRVLQRGSDYVLGGDGLIEFPLPLLPFTPDGSTQQLVVTYRSSETGAGYISAGVHLTRDFSVGNARGNLSVGALLTHDVPSFGVHGQLSGPGLDLDALLSASGGAVLSSVNGRYQSGSWQATLLSRAEGLGYSGPGAGSPGWTFSGNLSDAISPHFGVKLTINGSHTALPDTVPLSQGSTALSLTAGVAYLNAPFHAELALRRDISAGKNGVQGLIGYSAQGYDVTLAHLQDLSGSQSPGNQSLSTLTVSALLSPELRLNLLADHNWETGNSRAGLTLSGSRAGVNYLVGYDLPSEGGSLGRARLSATTSVPLSKEFSADLAASINGGEADGLKSSLGTTLRYQDPGTAASLGADATLQASGVKFDLKGAVNVSYGLNWTLSADALSEFGAGAVGNRFGLGLAWRSESASALGYLRYRNGTFGEDRFSGELDLEQRPELLTELPGVLQQKDALSLFKRSPLELREGMAFGVPLSGSAATVQGTADARYWLNDRLALGVGVGALYQSGSTLSTRLGLEATVVPFPGWGLSAGYNLLGFPSDLGQSPMKQGFYLKLDLMLDEVKR